MGISDLKDILKIEEKDDLETLVRLFTGEGEKRRLTTLDSQEKWFIFDLYSRYLVYFANFEKIDSRFKSNIPHLLEVYMDLAVSESKVKEKSLIEIIRDIFIAREQNENQFSNTQK